MKHLHQLAAITLLLSATAPARAQIGCDGRGSRRVPDTWEAGLALLCPYAPDAPGFHLFTPEHREVTPHAGFHLGEARALTQWIVRYRCTGLRFLPVVVSEVRAYGLVLDVEEQRCVELSPVAPGG